MNDRYQDIEVGPYAGTVEPPVYPEGSRVRHSLHGSVGFIVARKNREYIVEYDNGTEQVVDVDLLDPTDD